jgi:uridine kinase
MAISKLQEMIEVQVQDIGSYLMPAGSTAVDLLRRIDRNFKYPVTAVVIDNNLKDLHHVIENSCQVELVDTASEAGFRIYRRSATFMLLKACHDLFHDRKLMIKHSLSNGMYCEFLDGPISQADIIKIDRHMRKIVAANLPIRRMTVSKENAREIFSRQGQLDKVRLFEFRDKETVHIHELDGFYEYFYGYMVPETGMVSKFALINYSPGIVLQTPETEHPDKIEPYIEQKKLATIYRETSDWVKMLDTPHVAALNDIIKSGRIFEIVRINEALHAKKIAFIADEICKNHKTRLVLISGPSSSGKTTFAQRLQIQLKVNGKRPVSISLDNYFIDRELTPRDENNDYDFEALEALKIDLINEHLGRLIAGEEVEIPIYSFYKGRSENVGVPLRVAPGEPIIIEGIHGLNDNLTWSIPQEQKFKIYISALTQLNIDYTNRIPTTDSRLIRRIIRDSRTRGYSALETLRRWPSVRRGENRNIFPFQEKADVMFNSSLVYELAVLKPFIEPLLTEISSEVPEHVEARRLLKFVSYFRAMTPDGIPPNSILREFIGDGWFK